MSQTAERGRTRDFISDRMRHVEHVFYVAIAVALAFAGAALFFSTLYSFFRDIDEAPLITNLLRVLDSMLLVFIITELIHTVRAVIAENVLMTEPFLIVGIVAVIRRLVVISAETSNAVGRPEFSDLMLEMGILVAAAVALAFAIFLIRHTTRTEPRPAHEPER